VEVKNRANWYPQVGQKPRRPHVDQSRRAGGARRAGRALRHMSFAASDRPVHRQPAAGDKRPVEDTTLVPRERIAQIEKAHHRPAPAEEETLAGYRSVVVLGRGDPVAGARVTESVTKSERGKG
jgi:hypothetical protein